LHFLNGQRHLASLCTCISTTSKLTKFDRNYIHIHDQTVTIIYLGETFKTSPNLETLSSHTHNPRSTSQISSNTTSFIWPYTIYVPPFSKKNITNWITNNHPIRSVYAKYIKLRRKNIYTTSQNDSPDTIALGERPQWSYSWADFSTSSTMLYDNITIKLKM